MGLHSSLVMIKLLKYIQQCFNVPAARSPQYGGSCLLIFCWRASDEYFIRTQRYEGMLQQVSWSVDVHYISDLIFIDAFGSAQNPKFRDIVLMILNEELACGLAVAQIPEGDSPTFPIIQIIGSTRILAKKSLNDDCFRCNQRESVNSFLTKCTYKPLRQ